MIKRYFADKDTTITNAFKANLEDRGELGNMGASDVLENFAIFGQATTSSTEESKILVKFPIDDLTADRTAGNLPASGSVSFYLRLFNAEHGQTLPSDYYIRTVPVSSSWTEGHGLDMEDYTDEEAANWLSSSLGTEWVSEGGDYLGTPEFLQYFDIGNEDLEIDVTSLVESWMTGSIDNYGFGVAISSSFEAEERSYYTKKFFARGSEFFFKRPVLEARYDSSIMDDRGEFYCSSSLADINENTNHIYLYNSIRGSLRDIPAAGTGSIYVNLYEDDVLLTTVTGSWIDTGVYTASVELYTTASTLSDVWFVGSDQFYTGSITVKTFDGIDYNPNTKYYTSCMAMKPSYTNDETVRFRFYVREKNWQPNIYVQYNPTPEVTIIPVAHYKILRAIDDEVIIDYDLVDNSTLLSYDVKGNYFDLNMDLFEPDYAYKIKLQYQKPNGEYEEQNEYFKFRVVEN